MEKIVRLSSSPKFDRSQDVLHQIIRR